MPRSLVLLLALTACAGGGGGGQDGSADDGASGGTDEPAADALEGDDDGLALEAIPDADPDPYGSDHIEMVGEVAYATDRLVIAVAPEATVGDINALLRDIDATILGGSPHGGLLVVSVPPGTAAEAESAATDAPGVLAALVDASLDSERLGKSHDSGNRAQDFGCPTSRQRWRWDDASIGRTPAGQWDTQAWNGANWGLKFGRVPLAWSLRDHMSRVGRPPTIGIIDKGFHAHADVTDMVADGDDHYHGLAVTSVAVAGFTDRQGIEGVFPRGVDLENTVLMRSHSEEAGLFAWSSRRLVHSTRMLGGGARLVNSSQGWSKAHRLHPEDSDRYKSDVAKESAAWAGAVRGLAHFGVTEFIVTCSAGNAGKWYPAEWNSGCGNRAANGDTHFMSVEALAAPGNALASLSGSGGTASAAGECVGVDYHGSTTAWVSDSGTSYAAPFVAGAAAMVWAADPDLTHVQVRAALLESAHPAVTDVAPRIDAFAALLYIDTLRGDQAIQTALADIDDGSPDGNLRLAPVGSELDATGPADDRRGDGCVDIKDLRVLRDAILDSRAGDASDALDGPTNHTNRDLNGDGKVLPGDAADVQDDADLERVWSRYDLNGDLIVDEADLTVMAEVWGATDPDRCPVADTRGIAASSLTQWVQSADAWVHIPDGTTPLVRVEGAAPIRPTADDLHGGWSLSTSLLACDGEREIDTCLHGDDEVSCDTRSLQPGDDAHVSDTTEVTSAEGLVFLSRDNDLYTAPLRIFSGTGAVGETGSRFPTATTSTGALA